MSNRKSRFLTFSLVLDTFVSLYFLLFIVRAVTGVSHIVITEAVKYAIPQVRASEFLVVMNSISIGLKLIARVVLLPVLAFGHRFVRASSNETLRSIKMTRNDGLLAVIQVRPFTLVSSDSVPYLLKFT